LKGRFMMFSQWSPKSPDFGGTPKSGDFGVRVMEIKKATVQERTVAKKAHRLTI